MKGAEESAGERERVMTHDRSDNDVGETDANTE